MGMDVVNLAWKYMRRRKFSTALKLLESKAEIYEDSFEYYFCLGTACLYVGDVGSAVTNYALARKIKITDTRLLIGQAAIYLRRGDTDRALQYYMEVKDNEPNNQIANDALEFIRARGDYDTMDEIFGHSVDFDRAKPTNSEFLATLADNLALDERKIKSNK